jgi:hypothetical protein
MTDAEICVPLVILFRVLESNIALCLPLLVVARSLRVLRNWLDFSIRRITEDKPKLQFRTW